jgi:hypothetical protein
LVRCPSFLKAHIDRCWEIWGAVTFTIYSRHGRKHLDSASHVAIITAYNTQRCRSIALLTFV